MLSPLAVLMLAALAVAARGARYTGRVMWEGNVPAAGVTVTAYDDDTVGREYMGRATTASDGNFIIDFISPQVKNWDSCCFSSKRPDPLLEVTIGGALWLKTDPVDNVPDNRAWGTLLLRSRNISGMVRWQAAGSPPAAGALVRAYDNDPVGRELMGEATTNAAGEFGIRTSLLKQWDSCCGSSTNPDIVLEVWIGGARWFVSNEASNVPGSYNTFLGLQRITVTGTALWQETCAAATGVSVSVRDDDTAGSQTMASGSVSSTGAYSINVNPREGGDSTWDLCCGSDRAPDIFTRFDWGGGEKGRTSVSNNYQVAENTSPTISQGTTRMWRGDVAPGAAATETVLDLDTVDWVEVMEYPECKPPVVLVSIIINFQKENDMSNAQWDKLRGLAKQGIAENWSRTGPRAVRLSNNHWYDVVTRVVERSEGHNVELYWVYDDDCKRSNNVGSVAFFDLDPIVYYREGCARAKHGADWEANEDYVFKETAAHEFGHSILRASPPSWVSREWFGPIPLSLGQSWSWTHKGTSSIYQNTLASAPNVPATGDWDLMKYYNGGIPAGAYDRSFATEDDVARLVGIAEIKRKRTRTCACPKY